LTRAEDFLQFAMRLYGRPGVKPVCLALQDEEGLNVNCLLAAAWAAALGFAVSEEGWRALEHATEALRVRALDPVRAVRKQIGREPKISEQIRGPVKRLLLYAELRIEQAEERVLHDRLPSVSSPAEPGGALLRANLAAYAGARERLERFARLVEGSGLLEERPWHNE
jgi:uncharacterized protein (TIGR02444 family)